MRYFPIFITGRLHTTKNQKRVFCFRKRIFTGAKDTHLNRYGNPQLVANYKQNEPKAESMCEQKAKS